jgi:endonuclease-3
MNSKIALKQLRKIQKLNPNNLRLAGEKWPTQWQTLIAIMLSAQTRDSKTIEVCKKLFLKYNNANKLSFAKILDIEKEINSINYYKTKAKHIHETSKILSNKKIPNSIEELIKLPGVGRKTASVFLSETGKGNAIGVDTHVFRISHKLGWVTTSSRDKTEEELKKIFPKKYWNEINTALVKFGQTYGRSSKREDEVLKSIIE